MAGAIRQASLQPDHKSAAETWRHAAEQLRACWPKLGAPMDEAEADVPAYMAFPSQHLTKLHGTNPLERLNKGVNGGATSWAFGRWPSLPNKECIVRLIGAVFLEAVDGRQLPHREMQVGTMTELDAPPVENPALVSTTAPA